MPKVKKPPSIGILEALAVLDGDIDAVEHITGDPAAARKAKTVATRLIENASEDPSDKG